MSAGNSSFDRACAQVNEFRAEEALQVSQTLCAEQATNPGDSNRLDAFAENGSVVVHGYYITLAAGMLIWQLQCLRCVFLSTPRSSNQFEVDVRLGVPSAVRVFDSNDYAPT